MQIVIFLLAFLYFGRHFDEAFGITAAACIFSIVLVVGWGVIVMFAVGVICRFA